MTSVAASYKTIPEQIPLLFFSPLVIQNGNPSISICMHFLKISIFWADPILGRLALGIWVNEVFGRLSDTFVGLAMSDNIQKYLIKEGYPPLIVYNRTASKADPLKKYGVIVAESVEDAVSKSDIIFSCVFSAKYCINHSSPTM